MQLLLHTIDSKLQDAAQCRHAMQSHGSERREEHIRMSWQPVIRCAQCINILFLLLVDLHESRVDELSCQLHEEYKCIARRVGG